MPTKITRALTMDEAMKMVAVRHGLGSTLVTGHKLQYFKEAMMLHTKSHVEDALRCAADAIEEYRAWGDTDKIKNSYPLKNIK